MRVEFLEGKARSKCVSCDRVDETCFSFRIHHDDGLHPAYRTLYNPKCRMCSSCRDMGDEYVASAVHRLMQQYIGGCT